MSSVRSHSCGLKASSGFSWQLERCPATWLVRPSSLISFSPHCSLRSSHAGSFSTLPVSQDHSGQEPSGHTLPSALNANPPCPTPSSSTWGKGLLHKPSSLKYHLLREAPWELPSQSIAPKACLVPLVSFLSSQHSVRSELTLLISWSTVFLFSLKHQLP